MTAARSAAGGHGSGSGSERGAVIANMSMSLDGFVENQRGGVGEVFAWTTAGPETSTSPGYREFRTAHSSADLLREAMADLGALVCGRTLFDLTHGWGGRHPTGAPVIVVTHQPPTDWPHDNATFVTDGVAAAVEQAHTVAAGRTVAIASASITRQCLDLGLLDGIMVDLVPVVLGAGRPFLAGVSNTTWLTEPVITPGHGVTHLYYETRRRE